MQAWTVSDVFFSSVQLVQRSGNEGTNLCQDCYSDQCLFRHLPTLYAET
jgi:hypothetical protein